MGAAHGSRQSRYVNEALIENIAAAGSCNGQIWKLARCWEVAEDTVRHNKVLEGRRGLRKGQNAVV